ncbi:helix-turn-helix domain-containing protein [Candidatus Riflebacteria bacterium]
MIRYRLKELIAEKEFREERKITIDEISKKSGIHRSTLTRILRTKNYNTTVENLEKLCNYFECTVDKLVEFPSEKESN